MKIDVDTLTGWARLSSQTNGKVNRAFFQLSQEANPSARVEAALALVTEAQGLNNRLYRELQRAGADDPDPPRPGLPTSEEDGLSLAQMTSAANKRLAQLLRETAEVASIVEAERGEDGGLSEILTGYAEARELEVYGPVGLREGAE